MHREDDHERREEERSQPRLEEEKDGERHRHDVLGEGEGELGQPARRGRRGQTASSTWPHASRA